MRKRAITIGVVALALVLATPSFAANRGVQFTPIGFVEDPGPFAASTIWDVSADGTKFIAGSMAWGGDCNVLSYPDLEWTVVGGNIYNQCLISNDGAKVMADIYDATVGYSRSGVWNGTPDSWSFISEPDDFVPCPSSGIGVKGIGGSADFATGLTWEANCKGRAFLWNGATDVSVNLGAHDGRVGRGNEVSADGATIGGWSEGCFDWRGVRWDDGVSSWVDGQPDAERLACVQSGDNCCTDTDCPEYVDDSSCSNVGSCDLEGVGCVNGTCVGGTNEGEACYGNWNCAGSCTTGPATGEPCTGDWACPGNCDGGPNAGAVCTGDYECPDTVVCAENPGWEPENYKGEVTAMTPDGQYMAGIHYGDPGDWQSPNYTPTLWASGYILGPEGFIQLLPPEGADVEFTYWVPTQISDDGSVVLGNYGAYGGYPVLWTAATGTIDLQVFLLGQGLDDLWFWYLTAGNALSGDGMIIGGHGYDPPGSCQTPFGDSCLEGYIVDISKVKVCHKRDTPAERTLSIAWESVGDHLGHGDQLAICEFANSYGDSRSATIRETTPVRHGTVNPEWHTRPLTREEYVQQQQLLQGRTFGRKDAPVVGDAAEPQGSTPDTPPTAPRIRKRVRQ